MIDEAKLRKLLSRWCCPEGEYERDMFDSELEDCFS